MNRQVVDGGAGLGELAGFRLYVLTVALQGVVGGAARWLVVWVVWSVGCWVFGVGGSPTVVAWCAVVVPLVWSMLGLWWPGGGVWWSRFVGAREPTSWEAERVEEALRGFGGGAAELIGEFAVYVLEDEDLFSFVRGRALIVSRGLVRSVYLRPVLAHELGHVRSVDGVLMVALDRLLWWGDVLGAARGGWVVESYGGLTRLGLEGLRLLFWVAGGAGVFWFLRPAWAAYWRGRDREADRYAVELGQAVPLAEFLEAWVAPGEGPNPRVLFNLRAYDSADERVDELRAVVGS